MSRPIPAALSVSQIALRALIILNWIYGAAVFAILLGLLAAAGWTMMALGFAPSTESAALVQGLRVITVLGLAGVPLNFIVLSRLLAIVNTVRSGDPFVADNADRLQLIAWAILGQQLLQFMVGMVASCISTPANPLRLSVFSTGGWLAVILLFVLARVFAEGSRMRDELEGTV